MANPNQHTSHPKLISRLKRANGHLLAVIRMIEEEKPCLEIAQQMQAVESAVTNAKRTLIHDHIDHCLNIEGATDLSEMKAIAKLL